MERGKINDVLSMIKGIEDKNADLEKLLSSLSLLSRKKMLEEITQDIIKNNDTMKKIGLNQAVISKSEPEKEPHIIEIFIENTISEIEEKPTNQVIILRDFLDRLSGISDNDKNVMLATLTDSEADKLKDKLLSLTKIFTLNV